MAAFTDSVTWSDYSVLTLLNMSLQSVVFHWQNNINNIAVLPSNLKEKILYLMTKRGLMNDTNITMILHKDVRVLDLSECDVSDDSLQTISQVCSKLRKMDLNSPKTSRTAITSQGIQYLARGCKFLQTVYARRCINLTDEAVVTLSQCCPLLRELNIGGCPQITDLSLESLGQNSRHLRSLNVSKSSITDQGIMRLAMGVCARSVKELHIDGCIKLTDEAVEAIVQFCPQISILLFHGCPNITEQARSALEELSLSPENNMRQVTWTIY